MSAIGAKYHLKEGKILHAAYLWKSPSKRRIPRILIEARALEVGILMYIEEPWMIFQESKCLSKEINQAGAVPLEFYYHRYHLLPKTFRKVDTYLWLKLPGHKMLLWGKDNHYFIKAY